MTLPLVLVSADVRDFDNYRWHAVPAQYVEAVTRGAGAIPVVLPSLGPEIDAAAAVARVDGVVLTGSRSNVHPTRYGVAPSPAHEPYDPARDATTFPLIRAALDRGVPLLAICRGFQELNVALGGTLHTEIQELPGRMDHRSPPVGDLATRFAIRHPVRIVAGSCLGRVLEADEILVNSLHRQGVATLAPGLVVEAEAPDGTIEAVRVADVPSFAMGVQWHPEFWVGEDRASTRIFRAFGDAVRAHAVAHGRVPA